MAEDTRTKSDSGSDSSNEVEVTSVAPSDEQASLAPSRDRNTENRESKQRERIWKPAPLLPNPDAREGLEFRYVRSSMRGESDNINVSQALRDGWEPVLATEYPELKIVSDRNTQYPDNIEVGGLLLCSRPTEIGEQLRARGIEEVNNQMMSVDRSYFREQDPRMPLLTPERKTRVTFGED